MKNSIIVVLLFWALNSSNVVAQQVFLSGFESIKGFQIAPNGAIYVLDGASNSISRFTESGELEFSVGSVGVGISQFDTPNSLELGAGLKLLVADPGNKKVVQFDRNLQYLGELNSKSSKEVSNWKPTHALSLSTAELWVYNQTDESLIRFDENGQFKLKSFLPEEIHVGELSSMIHANSSIWLVNKEKSLLFEFSGLGKYRKFIQLPLNTKAITSNQQYFYVATDSSLNAYKMDSFALIQSQKLKTNLSKESVQFIFIHKKHLYVIYNTFITRESL